MFHLCVKPRPPWCTGRRHARPRGRLLGDHSTPGCAPCTTSLSSRRNSIASRFSRPPELVRHPLARLARVVEVEHRRDRVDAQAVDVELLEPVERVGDEEVAHLVAAEVEDERAPVRVLALPRVGVLVERACRRSRPSAQSSLGKCAGTQSTITPMPRWCSVSTNAAEVVGRAEARASARSSPTPGSPTSRRTGARPPAAARRG